MGAGFAEKVAQAHDKRWTYEALVHVLILQPLGITNEVAVRAPEAGDVLICNGHILEKPSLLLAYTPRCY